MRRALLVAASSAALIASAHAQVVTVPGPNGNPITPSQIDGTVYCDQYASLAACITATPAGAKMMLPPNTTYVLTTGLTVSSANVGIECPSWSTVIQRGAALAGVLINMTGDGDFIRGCTIDGGNTGGLVNTTGTNELRLTGVNALADHINVIGSGANINVSLSGAGDRLTGSTITGLGAVALPTQTGYGVWAINHVKVTIDNNTISNTYIDGIGFDGQGSQVIGNHVFLCHQYLPGGGGQIASYPLGALSTQADGSLIANNTVDAGGGTFSYGIEVHGGHVNVVGNTIRNQQQYGILLSVGGGTNIVGNTITNSGQSLSLDGIEVLANSVDFTITGNTVTDDQGGSATQRYGIWILAGTSDRFTISGNTLAPNKTGALNNFATGTAQVIRDNHGIDDVYGNVSSATSMAIPIQSTMRIQGTTTVTSITATLSPPWIGRKVTFIPDGIVAFTATNNIGNAFTSVAATPFDMTYNGTNWYLK